MVQKKPHLENEITNKHKEIIYMGWKISDHFTSIRPNRDAPVNVVYYSIYSD